MKSEDKWKELSSATVSDALDYLEIKGQCLGIKPLDSSFRIFGPAYTVKYVTQDEKSGTVGDFIENVPEKSVIIIDNDGRLDASVWGDILTNYAKIRNVGGTVINGVCRDSSSSKKLGYPIFSKGNYMRTGKDRVRFHSENVHVKFGEIAIHPGDLVFGDADGIVIIPNDRKDEVLERALVIDKKESEIIKFIHNGMTLKEARKRFGYHALQTKRTEDI